MFCPSVSTLALGPPTKWKHKRQRWNNANAARGRGRGRGYASGGGGWFAYGPPAPLRSPPSTPSPSDSIRITEANVGWGACALTYILALNILHNGNNGTYRSELVGGGGGGGGGGEHPLFQDEKRFQILHDHFLNSLKACFSKRKQELCDAWDDGTANATECGLCLWYSGCGFLSWWEVKQELCSDKKTVWKSPVLLVY